MAEIRLTSLSFRYPGTTEDTLSELNLEVRRGEAHALLGSSGAGKTTLLNLLSGLLETEEGQIYFDGQDVGRVPPWQRGVTQVFQFPVLYEAMSVRENLSFPARQLAVAEQKSRVGEIAARLGLDAVLELKPAALTLVQKQLTAIAKSLVRPDVSLVLLDEPLTAAQPEFKWQLRQTLKALQREMGATMIYVTHDQTEALTFADRVSVLHEGRILQTAEPAALLEQPAHQHVGYFVGSPGMNLLDGEIREGRCRVNGVALGAVSGSAGACQIGFRPEWARLTGTESGGAGLPVTIRATRTLTTRRERPVGLVVADFEGQEVVTRQSLDGIHPGRGWLIVDADRLVCFRDGWRLPANA